MLVFQMRNVDKTSTEITEFTCSIQGDEVTGYYEIVGDNFDHATLVIKTENDDEIYRQDYYALKRNISFNMSDYDEGFYIAILSAYNTDGTSPYGSVNIFK